MGKFYRIYAEELYKLINSDKKRYASYLETGGMPVPTAVWTDGDIYIIEEGNVLSILTKSGKANLFKVRGFVLAYLKLFGSCEFHYSIKNRNKVFIERLIDSIDNARVITRDFNEEIKITGIIKGE